MLKMRKNKLNFEFIKEITYHKKGSRVPVVGVAVTRPGPGDFQ